MQKNNASDECEDLYIFDRPATAVSAFVVAAGPIVAASGVLARP